MTNWIRAPPEWRFWRWFRRKSIGLNASVSELAVRAFPKRFGFWKSMVVEDENRRGKRVEIGSGNEKKGSEKGFGFGFWELRLGLGFSYSSRKPSPQMGQDGSDEAETDILTVRLHL